MFIVQLHTLTFLLIIPTCRHFKYSYCTTTTDKNNTHRPTSCAVLASESSQETGEGQVTCWYWWGKAFCLLFTCLAWQLVKQFALPRNSRKL